MKDKKKQTTEYLSISKAAKMLGVHPNTLRKWDNEGKIKAQRLIGKRGDRRFKKEDLAKMLTAE